MLLLDPKGPIGEAERSVIIAAIVLMAIVVVPVFIMAVWFPLRYRASNTAAVYRPKWSRSAKIEFAMWAFPMAIVAVLAVLAWTSTHALDPYKPIRAEAKPLTIEAVSQDWKWLFIYPELKIATVNQLTFPVNVPLSFKLTSDTVMTSFFIPQLGSQMYAMAGMQTRLNLLADQPGTYDGHNQQISGRGFADMHFKAQAVSREEFQAWVEKVRQSPEKLDLARYEQLAKPSSGYHPVTCFSSVAPDLFGYILRKFCPACGGPSGQMAGGSGSACTKPCGAEEN